MAADTPASFVVLLTAGAEQDLEAIFDYVCDADSVARANRVLDAPWRTMTVLV